MIPPAPLYPSRAPPESPYMRQSVWRTPGF
jgi:hypothetical protein